MSLFLLYFFAPRGAQHESLSPPPKQYKPPSITPNSLYPSLVPKAQPKGMPWEETSTGISSGCSWHRHAWAEQGAAGCGQSGAGRALVSPWGPAPSCCLPPPAPGAKTPREMPPGMGVLLKGRTQGSVGGLRTSHPPRDPPKPHLETPTGTSLTYFPPPHRLLLLLPGGMCQVRAGLRLQGPPLCQVQLLQIRTPGCTSGGG